MRLGWEIGNGKLAVVTFVAKQFSEKRTECLGMQHCFEECEAEDAASVGTSMANLGEIRLGWEIGWRREAPKERCRGVVIEMWHCFEEREEEDAKVLEWESDEEDAKVLEWESDEMQHCFEECETEDAASVGTSIVSFGEIVWDVGWRGGCEGAGGFVERWLRRKGSGAATSAGAAGHDEENDATAEGSAGHEEEDDATPAGASMAAVANKRGWRERAAEDETSEASNEPEWKVLERVVAGSVQHRWWGGEAEGAGSAAEETKIR